MARGNRDQRLRDRWERRQEPKDQNKLLKGIPVVKWTEPLLKPEPQLQAKKTLSQALIDIASLEFEVQRLRQNSDLYLSRYRTQLDWNIKTGLEYRKEKESWKSQRGYLENEVLQLSAQVELYQHLLDDRDSIRTMAIAERELHDRLV